MPSRDTLPTHLHVSECTRSQLARVVERRKGHLLVLVVVARVKKPPGSGDHRDEEEGRLVRIGGADQTGALKVPEPREETGCGIERGMSDIMLFYKGHRSVGHRHCNNKKRDVYFGPVEWKKNISIQN